MNSMDFYTIVPGGHYRNEIIIRNFDLLVSIVTTEPTRKSKLACSYNVMKFSTFDMISSLRILDDELTSQLTRSGYILEMSSVNSTNIDD